MKYYRQSKFINQKKINSSERPTNYYVQSLLYGVQNIYSVLEDMLEKSEHWIEVIQREKIRLNKINRDFPNSDKTELIEEILNNYGKIADLIYDYIKESPEELKTIKNIVADPERDFHELEKDFKELNN